MKWERSSEIHRSRAEAGGLETGGRVEGFKHTPTYETRSLVNSILKTQDLREINRVFIVRLISSTQ
jgi:hypothetical protein